MHHLSTSCMSLPFWLVTRGSVPEPNWSTQNFQCVQGVTLHFVLAGRDPVMYHGPETAHRLRAVHTEATVLTPHTSISMQLSQPWRHQGPHFAGQRASRPAKLSPVPNVLPLQAMRDLHAGGRGSQATSPYRQWRSMPLWPSFGWSTGSGKGSRVWRDFLDGTRDVSTARRALWFWLGAMEADHGPLRFMRIALRYDLHSVPHGMLL